MDRGGREILHVGIIIPSGISSRYMWYWSNVFVMADGTRVYTYALFVCILALKKSCNMAAKHLI